MRVFGFKGPAAVGAPRKSPAGLRCSARRRGWPRDEMESGVLGLGQAEHREHGDEAHGHADPELQDLPVEVVCG